MDGGHPQGLAPAGGSPGGFGGRLAGAAIAGALLAGLGTVLAGLLVSRGHPAAGGWLSGFLSGGGGLAILLWGMGAGGLASLRWAAARREVASALATAAVAVALGVVAAGPPSPPAARRAAPAGARGKAREILRASYRSPASVSRIVEYAGDLDPVVREYAALALGINLVVDDVERATGRRPSRYANHPLRERIGATLRTLLVDRVEAVRAEAARALWKAPRCFGSQPAAAETLAAVLDRALRPGVPERLAWLALDAAAGAPHTALRAAAARFATATSDSDLAHAATRAAARGP